MRSQSPRPVRPDAPNDVGTLWTMQRLGCSARCAFMTWSRGWEVRVLVDNRVLLTEHCDRAEDAFATAERWKKRMGDQGWRQVVPGAARGVSDAPRP